MVSGGVIPGAVVDLRILKVHKTLIEAQYLRTITPSPYEMPLLEHFQIYGGCKWLPIPYEMQLQIKQEQVREAFHYLREYTEKSIFHPIVPSPEIFGYRNKVEFSFGKYISQKEGIHDEFRFGFHVSGQFDRIENCTFCVLASERVNQIFKAIDAWTRSSGIPTYDPKTQQ